MTRDDIIRMAKEAHAHHLNWDADYIEGTERFAALVAAAEREACAKLCANMRYDNIEKDWSVGAALCAEAIRQGVRNDQG